MLRRFEPTLVHVETGAWDFPPPVDFAMLHRAPHGPHAGTFNGCWGMSFSLGHRLLARHGYRIIGATGHDLLAVHASGVHLFADRPADVWYWYEFASDAHDFTHWHAGDGVDAHGGRRHAQSPADFAGSGLGLYTRTRTQQRQWTRRMRTINERMLAIAQRVALECRANQWLLAVGDRCCAHEWNVTRECSCALSDLWPSLPGAGASPQWAARP